MRESALRGFWVTTGVPFGYRKVYVPDGPKKRPKLEMDPPADTLVRRIFRMDLNGRTTLENTKTLNAEGIATPEGKTLAQDLGTPHPFQRDLHRRPDLGRDGQGQRVSRPR